MPVIAIGLVGVCKGVVAPGFIGIVGDVYKGLVVPGFIGIVGDVYKGLVVPGS